MAISGNPKELVRWLSEQPPDKTFELREKRRKRSLTQNAYYWAMLNQLARVLRISDREAHMQMLRQYGVCEVVSLDEDVPPQDYFEYWDEVGLFRVGGDMRRSVRVYKRSRNMDSKEFSALVDGLRYECQEQGIPFMTPSETASLPFEERI